MLGLNWETDKIRIKIKGNGKESEWGRSVRSEIGEKITKENKPSDIDKRTELIDFGL